MNTDYIYNKQKIRKQRIAQYAEENNCEIFEAAMWIDMEAPLTTNRKMLAEAGFEVNEITEDNYKSVITALRKIHVTVFIEGASVDQIVKTLPKIIDEQVNEVWGGEDTEEFVQIF